MRRRSKWIAGTTGGLLGGYIAVYLAWRVLFAWHNPEDRRYWCFFSPPLDETLVAATEHIEVYGESGTRVWFRREGAAGRVFALLVLLDEKLTGQINRSGHSICGNTL